MSTPRTRVLLVDDHAVVRAGFRRLLEGDAGIEVVGDAGTADLAYRRFVELTPDVTVLDLSMPDGNGLEILRRLIAREAEARVVVFSMHEDAAQADRALALGARGYVTKSSAPELLAEAVRVVMTGGRFLSPDIAEALHRFERERDDDPLRELNPREFEIFRRLVNGDTTTAIATALNLSPKTIANYQTGIKQKLGVNNEIELARLALRAGLMSS